MAEPSGKAKLAELIEQSGQGVDTWAKRCKLARSTLFRLLQHGKTNSLRTAVLVQRATKGLILPEEWL